MTDRRRASTPVASRCAHCGRTDVGTQAAGFAVVSPGRTLVCHPNVSGRPDCYLLVTTYHHPLPCHCNEQPVTC